MTAKIIQGDVFDVLPTINAGSVDCVVTSPPYWRLRSYLPAGHPLKSRELGAEATPAEFVQRMVDVFRLVRNAIADHATCWINIGDTYAGDSRGLNPISPAAEVCSIRRPSCGNIPSGNLCLIPQRLAIALQDDGWIVRSMVIWHKPSPMPQSLAGWAWRRCMVKVSAAKTNHNGRHTQGRVGQSRRDGQHFLNEGTLAQWKPCPGCAKCEENDGYVLRRGSWRPTSSYEPIIMLAKCDRYYCDGDAVKTKAAESTISRNGYSRIIDDPDEQYAVDHDHETLCTSANLRDVWTIPAEPLAAKHYAPYPSELVYRCLAAGTSSKGYCSECGSPWCRVVEKEKAGRYHDHAEDGRGYGQYQNGKGPSKEYDTGKTIAWRPSCSCNAGEPVAGTVLDPFNGSGRTGIQAGRLGHNYIGVDLNPEYVSMSSDLLTTESPLFSGCPSP